jgi:23S rRNA (pseudouridine1915-N3)-methyltransferase
MKISAIWIGKTSEEYLRTGIDIYNKRIVHYFPFEIITLPDIKKAKNLGIEQIKIMEGDLILKKTGSVSGVNILLDERGRQFDSPGFSKYIQKKAETGHKQINFIIGGAFGFSDDVVKKANESISLSQLTFSHQLVRLIFMEQLYRACTIMNNEPYHHA